MKKFLIAVILAFSAACTTTQGLSPNAAIAASYQTVEVLVDQAAGAVVRGRMSPEQGEKVLAQSRKARATITEAENALKLCGVDIKNCDSVQKILDRVQPILLEMERELRAKEKK
jgi:hypothetical protein